MKLATRSLLFIAAALPLASSLVGQNVVTDWNTIASSTIVAHGGKGAGAASVWFSYESIAVYDAVNSIHREFKPFYYDGRCSRYASDEAAAVAAAHRILVYYFPGQRTSLDASYAASLAQLVTTARAKTDGVAVGEAAAQAVIAARIGDGLEAAVPYMPGSGPGFWQPTPPGFLAAATPWLGQMRPFTLTSASQFLPPGPYVLSTEEWAANYNVTRLLGEKTGSVRTAGQTEIGLFWTENTSQQYARAFNYLVQHYRLDLMDSARMMAMLWTGSADSVIGCFNAKYTFNFWRPVTAIQAGGGNSELAADPAWTPLGTTPNHPEYPAAHACFTSGLSHLVEDFFGTAKVHVVVDSLVFTDGVHTHTFENTADWLDEVSWARVFAGFHFLHSLQDGSKLGESVAEHVKRTSFRREHRE